MNYVDAGYAVGLSVLFLYALGLLRRRRRLERAVDLTPPRSDPLGEAGETVVSSGP